MRWHKSPVFWLERLSDPGHCAQEEILGLIVISYTMHVSYVLRKCFLQYINLLPPSPTGLGLGIKILITKSFHIIFFFSQNFSSNQRLITSTTHDPHINKCYMRTSYHLKRPLLKHITYFYIYYLHNYDISFYKTKYCHLLKST